ncbi:MAG: HAMP domain-containing histidine kinase [Rhodospirillales bacterium]|nr:HAMP domain-containing histidine kinase [Rhodospirillales bacterium]
MARIRPDIIGRKRRVGKVVDPALAHTQAHSLVHSPLAHSNDVGLSRISHELRTPLNAIIGFAEMSEQQPFGELAEPYLGYVSSIRNAAEHLLHVVDDILGLAEIEADRAGFAVRPVCIAEILNDARDIIADRAEANDIDISDVTLEDHWFVPADADRLKRVCVNLLDNAVKFTPAGGRIGVDVDGETASGVHFIFWDTGPGIAADRHAGIFDGFKRDPAYPFSIPAADGGNAGTGLGLAVARRLAQHMQGDITLQSELGRGARFTLRLPSLPDTAQAAE